MASIDLTTLGLVAFIQNLFLIINSLSVSLLRNGENLFLDELKICWRTSNRKKPVDNLASCGMFTPISKYFNIECQLTIGLTFMNGFFVLVLIAMSLFCMIKRQYDLKMKETEKRMRELGLVDPLSVLALDEWETDRDNVVMNRKLGEGAFGMVYGGELWNPDLEHEDSQWVSTGTYYNYMFRLLRYRAKAFYKKQLQFMRLMSHSLLMKRSKT